MKINSIQGGYNNSTAFGKFILSKEVLPEYEKFLKFHLGDMIKEGNAEGAQKYMAERKEAFLKPLSLRLVKYGGKEDYYVPEFSKDRMNYKYDSKGEKIYSKMVDKLGKQADDLDVYILPAAERQANGWGALFFDIPALNLKNYKLDNMSGYDINFIESDGKLMGVPTKSGIETIKNFINLNLWKQVDNEIKQTSIKENLINMYDEVQKFIEDLGKK